MSQEIRDIEPQKSLSRKAGSNPARSTCKRIHFSAVKKVTVKLKDLIRI